MPPPRPTAGAALLLAAALAGAAVRAASPWPDCSPRSDGHFPGTNGTQGPYGPVRSFNASYDGKPLVVLVPTGKMPAAAPLLVFMHGSTGQLGFYEPNLYTYASHGFVVVFPYIKGPQQDKNPLTTNTDGTYIIHGVEWAKAAAINSSSPVYGVVDTTRIVVAGHSMGATCSIMSATKLGPEDGVKLVVTQHPGICGPIGPPPWPSTWLEGDLLKVAQKLPMLFTTATNDGAFWPAPHTAEHELGCFHGALSSHTNTLRTAIFAQFSAAACAKDGERSPFDDSGHDCPFKTEVETPWVLSAIKFYTQQEASPASSCADMLFGNSTSGVHLASDPKVEKSLLYRPASA